MTHSCRKRPTSSFLDSPNLPLGNKRCENAQRSYNNYSSAAPRRHLPQPKGIVLTQYPLSSLFCLTTPSILFLVFLQKSSYPAKKSTRKHVRQPLTC